MITNPAHRGELRLVLLLSLCLGLGVVLSAGTGRFLGAPEVDFWGTQWFYWLLGRRILAHEPALQA